MAPARRTAAGSRRWFVLALVAVIALLVWWLRPRSGTAPSDAPAEAVAAARDTPPPSRWRSPPPQPRDLRPPSGPPLMPIIDEVIVEKPVVCRGEENLITVKAHTPGNAEDAYLGYFVTSETGQSVPLRLHDRSDEARGVQRDVIVFGRNGVAAKVPLPEYTIEDCDAPRQLQISYGLLANTENVFLLEAEIRDIAADEPMVPVTWQWTFSDGTTDETSVPTVEHDFSGRPQDTLNSQMLVTCTAFDAAGESVTGRRQIQLRNPAFEELTQKGLVRISTALDPRFPELDADGVVHEHLRAWHHRPDAVEITRLIAVTNFLPDRDGRVREPETAEVAPASVLGVTSIPAGAGIRAHPTLDTIAHPDIAYIEYYAEGVSAEGLPAHGNFALMTPPPVPTKENSEPVRSAYMKAKILRARELLGKEFVTDEDIWMLEREGRMSDLRPEDFPAPEPAPEGPRPPAAPAPR